jgi:hypothetical protein
MSSAVILWFLLVWHPEHGAYVPSMIGPFHLRSACESVRRQIIEEAVFYRSHTERLKARLVCRSYEDAR